MSILSLVTQRIYSFPEWVCSASYFWNWQKLGPSNTQGWSAIFTCFRMGKPYFAIWLGDKVFRCKKCKTHFGSKDDVMSKNFHGKTGAAYLFYQSLNYITGKAEDREMLTGLHKVWDVYCAGCQTNIGWKYEDAEEESEKYKIGKVIIERYYFEEVTV